jgi:hypothetical protein
MRAASAKHGSKGSHSGRNSLCSSLSRLCAAIAKHWSVGVLLPRHSSPSVLHALTRSMLLYHLSPRLDVFEHSLQPGPDLQRFPSESNVTMVLRGPLTNIVPEADDEQGANNMCNHTMEKL